ncbi:MULTISPECIES: flavin reductase family protein [Gordonia]|jgi:flavin reductase (DIM6/NTAB) family NADH-FMN oxidoreductase RutF|uniref:Flavin reductase n=2 Tax=Gordonia alkanivorans TaxID=84096 RepID=W9DJ66_9ACTN|nr:MULTISPECIES: flavin reductase family protein [Gordonia]ETA08589.1 flavin reductase [Gordonia alkanivorans CGMCC 6845]MDH3005251.1 flavin reductase family protein [Gordonia alkanivorans]MDH3010453.1 flavin reductase family protein [Gordonia alkanivorans]MDH3014663.1 flavin reductase family protein [Gordonia alkanivorans]MDH3019245.1 flavin reductase family protein [Gordonia alkanivorans]
MDQRTMRNIFGQFATGVTVITCANDQGTPHGATVTAFTPISIEPRLCQVTLTRKSKACGYLDDAPFAVNILKSDQLDTAMHFAGKPQEHGPEWSSEWLVPALAGNAATLICNPWASYDGGDHVIYVGEIVGAHVDTEAEPLLFYRSKFHDLGETSGAAAYCGSLDDPHSRWFDATARFTPSCVPLSAVS